MKRVLLSLMLTAAGIGLFAQSIDKVKDLLKQNKIADAKAEIDKVMAVDKNAKNAEAWYYKCKVYDAIASNDQLKATVPDAYAQAFDALKKYIEFDDKKLFLLMADQYKPMNDIYQGYFQAGAAAYNAGKYQDALVNFKGALAAIGFMSEKGWVTQKMDTTSTLYAGISSEKGGNRDEAVIYYSIIASNKIPKIGSDKMVEIYKWVADYYNQKKKIDSTMKYLAIGKELFPEDLFWPDMQLDVVREKGNKDSLFSTYESITQAYPTNHLFFFNYGLELYQYASDTSSGKRNPNADELTKKAQEKLTKSLEIKPDYPKAALVLGQISYNAGVDLQSQAKLIKGAKPEDIAKRKDLRTQASKKFDEAIPYFQKVEQDLGSQGKLKSEDKTALKDAYDLLVTIYEQKSQKDKAAAYTNKYNDIDKDH